MGKLQAQYCTCPGCQGSGRRGSGGHTTACTNLQKTEVICGSYCRRSAPNYLCLRCKHNAAPGNVSGQICDVCGRKRCKCPGCSACVGNSMCTRNGNHTGNPWSWCKQCKRSWSCAQCEKKVHECPKVPTAARCGICMDEVNQFLLRHSLDWLYLKEKDEDIYTRCVEIWSNLQKPMSCQRQWNRSTTESCRHMLETARVLHVVALQWTLTILAKNGVTTLPHKSPRYILLRENSSEPWTAQNF